MSRRGEQEDKRHANRIAVAPWQRHTHELPVGVEFYQVQATSDILWVFMPFHPLYIQGIEHFNAREYFEAHEVWEDLWKDSRGQVRQYYKGLIQVAVALHHFGNGNTHGARKLYFTSRGYLKRYLPCYLGLDLEAFLARFERCFAEIVSSDDERPTSVLVPALIPEIYLDPALGEDDPMLEEE